MTLTVYNLKTCDTCRKAIKALEAAGHSLTLIDVRADGVPEAVLTAAVDVLGWESVLNTRSTTWRDLVDAEKTDMSAVKAISLMDAHPTLIKRPLIHADGVFTVGWSKETQTRFRA